MLKTQPRLPAAGCRGSIQSALLDATAMPKEIRIPNADCNCSTNHDLLQIEFCCAAGKGAHKVAKRDQRKVAERDQRRKGFSSSLIGGMSSLSELTRMK
jgi:hypothetical protein